MNRHQAVLAAFLGLLLTSTGSAQTILSQYKFDGDLLNAATFVDPPPHGTFREGLTVAGSTLGTATFGRGVDGVENGALRLDGVDDWIDITTAGHPGQQVPVTSSTGPGLVSGTVMAWVRMDQPASAAPQWLMGSANTANTQSYRFGWNGTRLESNASGSANANQKFTVSDSTANDDWADGKWRHVAATWDGFASSGRIFIDGVQVGVTSGGSSLGTSTAQAPWDFAMAIGARNNGGTLDGFWKGLVDDLRIYRGQLTPAQVFGVFSATTVVPDPVVVSADFDDNDVVDGNDFLIWQRGFGVGTTFQTGDANGDGAVDADDLAVWRDTFGTDGQPPAVATVPEPATALLLAAGMTLLGTRSRRR